ncbi:MAG: hypothetical protein ACFFD2_14125, partial [Promethearchaeota archaeon]
MEKKIKRESKAKFPELVTFKVTSEMKEKMKRFDQINWSAWIRSKIQKKISDLEEIEAKSAINFCHICGKRLSSPNDRFCRLCGAEVPQDP